jgi:hypothetical protein
MIEDDESLLALLIGGQGVTLEPPLSTSILARGIVVKLSQETAPILTLPIYIIWNNGRLENGAERFLLILGPAVRADSENVATAANAKQTETAAAFVGYA